jgi:hypothetical protein
LKLDFVRLEEAKTGPHDIACRAITPLFDLRSYESGKMVPEGNRRIAGHETLLARK